MFSSTRLSTQLEKIGTMLGSDRPDLFLPPTELMTQPLIQNKFQDCVAMDIHLEAVFAYANSFLPFGTISTDDPTQVEEIELCMTINFNGEQEIEVPGGRRLGLPGGRVTFGIRRGHLRFELQNCHLPLDKTALTKPFPISIAVKKQKSRNSEIQVGGSSDTRTFGAKAAKGVVEETTVAVSQIKKIGSVSEPAWIFETQDDQAILEGMLTRTLLGTLKIAKTPCYVSASFTAQGEDVIITGGRIGNTPNIHRNKLAVIERAIARLYIKQIVEEASPLCEGAWQYG